MLKHVLPLLVVVVAAGSPAAEPSSGERYGPPSLKPALSTPSDLPARDGVIGPETYPKAEGILEENGIEIAQGGARRPIASNMEVAVEPARGLVNEYGATKKPMRLLLRLATSF